MKTQIRKPSAGKTLYAAEYKEESVNPSSSVRGTLLLVISDLRDLGAVFRHYIGDHTGSLGQSQAQVGEQLGGRGFGCGDDPQT